MREKVENDGELSNKILDLCLHQQIEESYQYMKLKEKQIKFCEIQIEYLQNHKPYWFQRKELKSYYEDIDLIEDQICNYYVQIEKEIRIIEELKNRNTKDVK